jgi:Bacterial membrane protein YfhO
MPPERRTDVLCGLGLLAAVTLLFADVLFFGSNFYFRDLYQYHMPLERIVRDTIAGGELPLWNRYLGGGQPLAANPAYEVFYPPQWLIFAGSFEFGFGLHIVAHVWLALIGMFVMLRAIPLRRAASLFGALSFGLSGLMLGAIANLPTFLVWAWAPVIGLTMLRLVREPGPSRFCVASLAAAMPLFVAEPFAVVQLWLLLMLCALAYARPRVPLVVGTALGSVVIAAVQLLPMADLVRHSSRSRGFSYQAVTDWSMAPVRPLELLAPRFFGLLPPDAHALWGAHVFSHRGTPYLLSLYAGVLVAILAMAGLVARVRGAGVAAVAVMTSYVLAIGEHTPLFAILYRLGLRSIRYPEKFAVMGVIALIVFAATIVNRIEEGDARLLVIAQTMAWITGGLLVSWAAVTMLPPFGKWFVAMFSLPPDVVSVVFVVCRVAMFAALIALGWASVLLGYARGHRRPALLAGLLLLLVDLGSFANEAVLRMPASFFRQPEIVQALDRDVDDYAIFHRGEWTQQTELGRYEKVSNDWVARNGLRSYVPALWHLRTVLDADFDETELNVTHDLLEAMRRLGNEGFERWSEPFMAVSNVRYVFDYRPFPDALREADGHREVWRPVRIQRVPSQGRYWFARGIIPVHNEDELLAAFRTIPDVRGLAFVPWPSFSPAPARVVTARETTNATELGVESSGRALLVITVTRDEHWRATIDGAPAELLPANVAYQALEVPKGRHHIEMRYRNPWITEGAIVSGLALLAAVIGCVWPSGVKLGSHLET